MARIVVIDVDTKQKAFESDNNGEPPRRGDYIRYHKEIYNDERKLIGHDVKWYRVAMIVNNYEFMANNHYVLVFASQETEAGEQALKVHTGLLDEERPYEKYNIREE